MTIQDFIVSLFELMLNSLHAGQFFKLFLSSADIFQKQNQEDYKSVKQFGSRSEPTERRS